MSSIFRRLTLLILFTHYATCAPFDPYIVCMGSPRDKLGWFSTIDYPTGYNSSLYPTYIDLCSTAFGAAVSVPGSFNVSSNNMGCACTAPLGKAPAGVLECTASDANHAWAFSTNYFHNSQICKQQCFCTTQAKADQYRLHGALADGQFYSAFAPQTGQDQVIPYGDPSAPKPWVEYSDPQTINASSLVDALERNPDRFCGFQQCTSNADCANFGVCGDCTITSHIPAYPGQPYLENQSYLWAVCQLPATPKGSSRRLPGNIGARNDRRAFESSSEGNVSVPLSVASSSNFVGPNSTFDYGCACNATFVRPECCGVANGLLPPSAIESFGTIAPFEGGELFTPAVATS